MLTALLQELRANSTVLDQKSDFYGDLVQKTSALLELAANYGAGLAPGSIDYLLAGVSSWEIPVYERAALDAALTGPELDVLDNLALRQLIAAWQRNLDRTVEVESQDVYYSLEVWMPLLREHTYLPQIWNTGAERVPGWQTSRTPMRGGQDHRPFIENREVVNALLEKKMVHEDILVFQAGTRASLADLIAALEDELVH